MNLVGKIFVFLIFCMSVVFMSFAVMIYATHKNWKQEVERTERGPLGERIGWKKRLEDEEKKNIQLQSQKRDLESKITTEQAAKRQEISKLEAKYGQLTGRYASLEKTYLEKVKELSEQLTKVQNQQDILENLRAENESMRTDIKTARGVIDEKFQRMLVLIEENHQAAGDKKRLEERRKQLIQELESAERVLSANNLTKHTPVDGAPPSIDGVITRVQRLKDNVYVEVTVGSDDGIQLGHDMEVFRGGKYLGQIEIVRTTPDKSVGKVDRSRQQGEIRVRDRVETRRGLQFSAG